MWIFAQWRLSKYQSDSDSGSGNEAFFERGIKSINIKIDYLLQARKANMCVTSHFFIFILAVCVTSCREATEALVSDSLFPQAPSAIVL